MESDESLFWLVHWFTLHYLHMRQDHCCSTLRQPLSCCDLQCNHILARTPSVHHSLAPLGLDACNCRVMAQVYVSGLLLGLEVVNH